MSWRDFQLKQQGFFEHENDRYKADWERARFVGFYAVAAWSKGLKKPTDLVKFAWEKEAEVELPTKEDIRYWTLKYGKYIDKDGNSYNA